MRQAATTRYYAGEPMRTASCADKLLDTCVTR